MSAQPLQNSNTDSSFDHTPLATSSGIQLKRDADILIQHFLPPATTYTSNEVWSAYPQPPQPEDSSLPLPLPLCIPQISVSGEWDSAFARGYNDNLHSAGISQQMLLNFIDGLNLAIQASPPLRVVNLVGTVIGFVPYHWAMIAGIVINTTAQTGMRILSKTLTDRYLRAANLYLFRPRGLSVRLCTTPAMLLLLSENENRVQKKKSNGKTREKLNKFGRGVGSVVLRSPIPLPIASRIVRAIGDRPPSIPVIEGETIQGSVLRRRLAVVQEPGLGLPLTLEGMPPPVKVKGVMDQMNAWGVKADSWMEDRRERKNEQRRRALKRLEEEGMGGWGGWRDVRGGGLRDTGPAYVDTTRSAIPSSSTSLSLKGLASRTNEYLEKRSLQREIESERRFQSRRVIPRIGLRESRMQRRVAEEDLLEHWATDKVLWVVIMSAENDTQIDGIEMAESIEEEERVDEETWRREMMQEREEIEEEVKQEGLKMEGGPTAQEYDGEYGKK